MTPALLAGAVLAVALFAAGACRRDPGQQPPPAAPAPQPAVPAPVPAAAAPAPAAKGTATYHFSEAGSKLTLVGSDAKGTRQGSVGTFSGVIRVVDGDLTKSSLAFDADMTSLATDDPKLTAKLKSPRALAVDKHPRARFTSTEIRAGGDLGATNTVAGDLDLAGTTRAVTCSATIHVQDSEIAIDGEIKLDPAEFGLRAPHGRAGKAPPEVRVNLEINATRVR